MKKCFACKSALIEQSTISRLYEEGGNMVVIKNIPCSKCSTCGEQYLTTEVVKRIEHYLVTVTNPDLEIVRFEKLAA
jgi:YgiT-type zinc finger domain-containing protein